MTKRFKPNRNHSSMLFLAVLIYINCDKLLEFNLYIKPTNTSWHSSLSKTLMKIKLSLTPYKTNQIPKARQVKYPTSTTSRQYLSVGHYESNCNSNYI